MAAIDMTKLEMFSLEALLQLNKAVVEVIRRRQVQREVSAARKFNVGDRARFRNSRNGAMVTIRIDKFNTKTVNGTELDAVGRPILGRTWRVTPSLLKPA